MPDAFASHSTGLSSPAIRGFAVTPDDDNDLANVTRGLWVGTGGNLVVTLAGDTSSVTLTNVADGTLLPLRVKRVYDTDTTASDIVGVY